MYTKEHFGMLSCDFMLESQRKSIGKMKKIKHESILNLEYDDINILMYNMVQKSMYMEWYALENVQPIY